MSESCPICLTRDSSTKICHNNHKTCKQCILIYCTSKKKSCPICRSDVYHFPLELLNFPYNANNYQLQHRYSDLSDWENFYPKDSKKIILNINLSIAKEELGGYIDINPNFRIYWGDEANITNRLSLFKRQMNEIDSWIKSYKEMNRILIVQRNRNTTAMRLVRMIPM